MDDYEIKNLDDRIMPGALVALLFVVATVFAILGYEKIERTQAQIDTLTAGAHDAGAR